MQYQTLKTGDVRQPGDQVRHIDGGNDNHCNVGYGLRRNLHVPKSLCVPGQWFPVNLLGHPILPIDLHVAEYRRPV